jgi:hypothetical protein
MRMAKQFSVFLVNKPGVLAQVTGSLAKARINLLALTLVDSSEHGVLRLVCDEPEDTVRKFLARTHDHFTETDVLVIELTNEPGAFADAATKLSEAHININYAYASSGGPGGRTTAIFKVADMKKALKVLAGKAQGTTKQGRGTVKTPPSRR